MGCPYSYYKDDEKYYPFLYCRLNGTKCLYQKKCLKVERYIPIDDDIHKECPHMIEESIKSIPKGSFYVQDVRVSKHGTLYIYVIKDASTVEKIKTDLKEINQNYVYLKETNGQYTVSLTPFSTPRKRKTNVES